MSDLLSLCRDLPPEAALRVLDVYERSTSLEFTDLYQRSWTSLRMESMLQGDDLLLSSIRTLPFSPALPALSDALLADSLPHLRLDPAYARLVLPLTLALLAPQWCTPFLTTEALCLASSLPLPDILSSLLALASSSSPTEEDLLRFATSLPSGLAPALHALTPSGV